MVDLYKIYESMVTIQEAMSKVRQELSKDPEYYQSWKASLSCSIFDEFSNKYTLESALEEDRITLHELANQAADRFLKMLL